MGKRYDSVNSSIERLDYINCISRIDLFLHKKRYEIAKKYCPENSCVLDLGCGFGWGANFLSSKCYVIGVDIGKRTIGEAKNRYRDNKKAAFKVADALNLPFKDKTFDTIVSIENIEHVDGYKKCLQEIKRVLKKNGYLVMSTPNREYFGNKIRPIIGLDRVKNPYHVHEFSEKELLKILNRKDFEIIKVKRLLFNLPLIILKFVEKNNFLINIVSNFTLPGFNVYFLVVAKKR